ncbi:MAG: outer membrane beta-barrel protein [Odoribacter splanchnicus]
MSMPVSIMIISYISKHDIRGVLSEDVDQRDISYDEQRYAIYMECTGTPHDLGFSVGLRDEYTEWNTQQRVRTQLHNNQKAIISSRLFVRKNMGQEMPCRLVIRNR